MGERVFTPALDARQAKDNGVDWQQRLVYSKRERERWARRLGLACLKSGRIDRRRWLELEERSRDNTLQSAGYLTRLHALQKYICCSPVRSRLG